MNEEQLMELLSVYRHNVTMPALPARRAPGQSWWWLAAAAAVVVTVLFFGFQRHRAEWIVNGRPLRAGETIATGSGERVRLESRTVGVIDVGAETRLRLLESRADRQELALAAGTIHAKTISPPGLFVVETPRASAVDLGCEYVLSISAAGAGMLVVSAGWVALNGRGQTLVPQGAKAMIESDGRVSAPVFEDAPGEFQESVRRYSMDEPADLTKILTQARRRDAFTLLYLFRVATTEERLRIYDRLNQLVPAPANVPRNAMLSWDLRTNDPWWPEVMKASGVGGLKKRAPR
jgi:hypothetical protein